MESTQNKIYEIEEQEAKPQFKNLQNGSIIGSTNEPDIYENDYGDKAELSKEQSQPSNPSSFNIKTGTNVVLMKNPPQFIKDAGEYEPLYPP